MEPRGVEPRVMEPRGVEPRGLETRGVEARVVEARGPGEVRGVEPRAMEVQRVEAPGVWQPVKLEKSSPIPGPPTTSLTTTTATTHTQPSPPQAPPVQVKPPPPPTPPPPSPPPDPPVSRLDVEEQRLRELREAGLEVEEAEEVLQEEAMARARALMLVCTKGPPAPLDTSHEKISFLNTVGLITHAHAQEAELFQCERRARVLGALEPSSIPSSPKHTDSISEELVPMLAPGHSLPPVITTPEELCLAHEYPHKARFLHHLGLQPQHSLHRQQEIEAVWQLVVQERLRRYRQESSDPLEVRVCEALEQLLTTNNHHQQSNTTTSLPSATTTSSLSVPLLKVTTTTTTTAAAAAATSTTASQSSSPTTTTTTATASTAAAVTTISTATQATSTAAASVVVTGTTATSTTTTATSTITTTTAVAITTTATAAPLVATAPMKAANLPVTVATTGHNTPTHSLNSKVVMSRVGGRIPMKDAFIMSSLPPEEDPLLAGLQGVDTVIEHFIKNAQAQGGSNNSLLLEHIEEVRRSQLAVCQTAQLVQEQVAQLVASRAQLEAHRSALHHHLAAITSIIASSTNHSATTTSATTPTTTGNAPSTISNSTQVSMAVPVTTSFMGVSNGAYTLAGGNCTTSTATTATSTSMGHGHPVPLTTTTSGLVTGHPVTAVINRSIQSMVPNAPAMSWAGLAPPYLGSTNISLSMENKDGVIYSHMTTKDNGKDAKTIVSSVNTSKPNRISLPHGNNKMPSSRHNSTKTQKHISIETSHISPVKYNGIPTNPPKQIFKPLQISGPNANVTLSKKSKPMTYCPPPSVTGHSQASVALVTPTTTVTNQNGLLPLPVNHNSVSKNGRTNKPQIGFTPYSKTSPTKVTQSWISN